MGSFTRFWLLLPLAPAFKRIQQLPEQPREKGLFLSGEGTQELGLVGDMGLDGPLNQFEPLWGQFHQHPATILWVEVPGHQPCCLQAINPIGHRSRGDHHLLEEVGGGKSVGWTSATQGGQDVKRPPGESEGLVVVLETALHMAGETGEPPDHAHRADVKIGARARPLG